MNRSPWDPLPVSQRIAERLSGAVGPEVWVVDDVLFPKCGKASVGVARTVLRGGRQAGELPGLLDTLAEWQLEAPVVVADAGYGVSTPFRLGLQGRGLSYVLALNGKEVAHPEEVEPHQPAYGGLGPPTLARRHGYLPGPSRAGDRREHRVGAGDGPCGGGRH